ncbi:dihydrolipoyl dehydrogenase family protein [Kineosporia succinea]|uniref:Dihydrolipoamide dehydrogenase n=1 Tax=Kineosporia succinea TaxID=84632 RepID=A0ABT9NZU2_9ACTN|nr:NAD(P)/FAD-dependent oxidoreductase [Kineosporia succinea]MDP9825949.1 dihydrolipoamide dehydrogenase [Kineosporia succinea]
MKSAAEIDGERFDVIVIGTGSAGKPLAGELARAGRRVLAVERHRFGGECAYVACVPSKSMLVSARQHRAHPAAPDAEAFRTAVAVRDKTVWHREDLHAAKGMLDDGVVLVRADATFSPGEVHLDHEATVRWNDALVLATGADAVIPPIEGLTKDAPGVWTSDVALSSDELPARLTILGGGAIGCELAEVYASFGCRVTLLESAPNLLPREQPWLGETLAQALRDIGVDVRTGTELTKVEGLRLTTRNGTEDTDRLLVAVGKKPVTTGFEALGLDPDNLTVDARMRVKGSRDIFAVGDLTAINPYTHGANYQARIVAAELLGRGRDADHSGTPRVVYTDPTVLAVGETEKTAADHHVRTSTARSDATGTTRAAVERTVNPDDHRPAAIELIADADTGVLIGAAAIGPEADSWAAELALAVRAGVTVQALADQPHAFPSWAEAITAPAQELAAALRE